MPPIPIIDTVIFENSISSLILSTPNNGFTFNNYNVATLTMPDDFFSSLNTTYINTLNWPTVTISCDSIVCGPTGSTVGLSTTPQTPPISSNQLAVILTFYNGTRNKAQRFDYAGGGATAFATTAIVPVNINGALYPIPPWAFIDNDMTLGFYINTNPNDSPSAPSYSTLVLNNLKYKIEFPYNKP